MKKSCQICGKSVIKMARHIRDVHGEKMKEETALSAQRDVSQQEDSPQQQTPKMNAESSECLDLFRAWCRTPEGGNGSTKTANTYRSQAARFVLLLGGVSAFVTDIHTVGQSTYLMEANVSASTLKTWFCALRKFTTFLMRNSLHGMTRDRCQEVLELIGVWSKSFRRQQRTEQSLLRETDEVLVPRVFQAVQRTLYGPGAEDDLKSMLGRDTSLPWTCKEDFVRSGDLICLRILAETGQRSGVVLNMLRTEFDSRTARGDSWVVRVAKHKTSSSHGSAVLVLTNDTCEMMKTFRSRQLPWSRNTCFPGGPDFYSTQDCSASGSKPSVNAGQSTPSVSGRPSSPMPYGQGRMPKPWTIWRPQ